MMTFKKYIYMILLAVAGTAMTTGCSDDKESMALDGQCMLKALTLGNLQAEIDKVAQTATIYVPEGTSVDDMELMDLTVSDGATASVKKGSHLDMGSPRNIRIKNGDLVLDWTLLVKVLSARIECINIDGRNGVIDNDNNTVTVYLPEGTDVSALVPTIQVSEGATVQGNEMVTDFTNERTFVVRNNDITRTYTVKVEEFDKPDALYIGGDFIANNLGMEEYTAYKWMLANVPKTAYCSLDDIVNGKDLSSVKIIYWHAHKDGGVDGHDNFLRYVAPFVGVPVDGKEPWEIETDLRDKLFNKLRTYYENGGAFFLTRYAGNLASFVGATGDDTETTPNNCWGQNEAEAELCGGPWSFKKWDDQKNHPLYAGLIAGENDSEVYCTDKGYHITNSTSQFHIGSDWGGFDDHNAWVNRTNGRILGVGGDGAIVAWEYPAHLNRGGIICIGSGCFDWYSYTYEKDYKEHFHKNITKMAQNAIDYLTK